jgi:uncharacterized protein (DUF111 family)
LGVKLSVLVSAENEANVMDIIFLESSSIGLRRSTVEKIALNREIKTVTTPYGMISVKCAFLNGKIVKYKAEYEECKKAALTHHVPIAQVYECVAMAMRT